ncbi:MAG: hypothetical protein ACWGQW_04350, partial [bacterium]
MAAANPPQELKIKTPEKDYQDPGPAEDRILSPEETENFFRTGSIDDPNAPEDDEEREQSQMAGDFFSGIPVDSVQPGQAPVKPREPSQDQLTQMVQHDQSIEQQVQQQIQGQGQAQPPGVQPQGQSQTQPPAAIPSPQEAALQAQVQQLGQQVQHLTQ